MKRFFMGVLCFLSLNLALQAEQVMIEVHLKIEDGDFGELIREARFNDEKVVLNDAKQFFPRRLVNFHTSKRTQSVEWTTASRNTPNEQYTVTGHKKVFSVAEGDNFVRVIIKGHDIWVK